MMMAPLIPHVILHERKNYLLISLLSLLLVGCVDTSRPLMQNVQQTLPYSSEKYISSTAENLYTEHSEPLKAQYNLADLIDVAQKNNPETRIAWELAKKAATDVGMVESTYLPVITATALSGYQRGTLKLPHNDLVDKIDVSNHVFIPAVTFQWLLFDFGKRASLANAAKHASFASDLNFNLLHQKVIHDVTIAYYTYGAAQKKKQIAYEALVRSKNVLYAVEQKRARGLATVLDVALAKQQVAQLELQSVVASGKEKDQYQLLLSSVGLSPLQLINVQYSDKSVLPDDIAPLTHDRIRKALAQRPDVLANYELMQAAMKTTQSVESDYYPKVYLAGAVAGGNSSLDVQGLPGINQSTSSSNILLGVSIPLYEGGIRQARMRNAQSDILIAQENLRKSQELAIREMSLTENGLKSALEAHKAAKNLVETTQLSYTASMDFYKNGLGTVTEINAAEIALFTAELTYIDAYTSSIIAAVDLAFALGEMEKALPSYEAAKIK
ncbi:TolC family protein [Moellerella wisconsensis]|uniref:Protein CyaE n=1 Tax=Moellerella wisconsensis ATCC 35017 TaxID=1354267 RepID=A0A0N0IC33_9GAMM|nr:TolC family protein [Moellerella wisconsensis]KPD04141.1 putative outer membrane protein [Moellerella wisconsensis ATCC 35017]UNH27623.1 TolC family protein [Moellerella wisconsensis]VFS52401.1 Cation efflux system protein CusC precursor [Moellerella wisconsensis]